MDVDGYCFLLISIGGGAGDKESPFIRAGYRLAEEEQQGVHECVKREKRRRKKLECGLLESQSAAAIPTPVINVWNAVKFSLDGKGLLQSQHFLLV